MDGEQMGIAQILDDENEHVGMGIVIDERSVLTAAHVIESIRRARDSSNVCLAPIANESFRPQWNTNGVDQLGALKMTGAFEHVRFFASPKLRKGRFNPIADSVTSSC